MKLFILCILAIFLISITSATVELGGQAGKDLLTGLGSSTGLWDWGETPLGHIIKDNKLIAGAWIIPEDRSFMETPLQASVMSSEAGSANAPDSWIVTPFGGYITLPSSYDRSLKDGSGVLDMSIFKVPDERHFPRVN